MAGVVGDLQDELEVGEVVEHLGECGREAGVDDDRPGRRVGQQVVQLFGDVAIVDVERADAGLQRPEHRLQVLVAVVQVDREMVLTALVLRQIGPLGVATQRRVRSGGWRGGECVRSPRPTSTGGRGRPGRGGRGGTRRPLRAPPRGRLTTCPRQPSGHRIHSESSGANPRRSPSPRQLGQYGAGRLFVVAVDDLGDARRLGRALDLEDHGGRHLRATLDVVDAVEGRSGAQLRADRHG